jgi:hypothetical protein
MKLVTLGSKMIGFLNMGWHVNWQCPKIWYMSFSNSLLDSIMVWLWIDPSGLMCWTLGPKLEALFWKDVETLRSWACLEELGHWEPPCSLFFFLVGLGFELWALCLQRRHSITWATPPVYFAQAILEMGVLRTICQGWPQTVILPMSAPTQLGLQAWAISSQFVLCFLSVMNLTASSSTCSCRHEVLPHHEPRINKDKDYGLKSMKTWAKINLSSFELFSEVFCSQWQKAN